MSERRTYGTGGIYQRNSDGRWIGTVEHGWNDQGKRRRTYVTGKTQAEVKRRVRDKLAEQRKAEQASAPGAARKTVKAWAEEWLTIRERLVRPNTYTTDRASLYSYVIPTIGTKRLHDLAPRDVRAVEAKVRAAGHGSTTVLRTRRTIVKMLRDAVDEGYVVPSTIFNTKSEGQGQKGRAKPSRAALEMPQAVAVLAQAQDLPHGIRYLVGFYQGLRQGEALGLTWDAIDFEANTITVAWQLQAIPYADKNDRSKGFRLPDDYDVRHLVGRFHLVPLKTSSGERVIPMVPTIRKALLHWRDVAPKNPHGLLWARADGWPIDKHADAEEFKALQKAAGVTHPAGRHFVTHEMRNTTATLLHELGIDPLVITAIMGHSSYVTSQGYMTTRQPRLAAAMTAIEEAFTVKAIG